MPKTLPEIKSAPKRPKIQPSAVYGVVLAFGGLIAALVLQGGRAEDLLQLPSALLVICGTAGAVLITMPIAIVREALEKASTLFYETHKDAAGSVALISRLVRKARKTGLVSLEGDVEGLNNHILRKAVRMATDGLPAPDVLDYMRLEIRLTKKRLERNAAVFEAAGGYAPTLGILGAVLGLIQVMKHLDQIATVGHGIAEAFVSTIYGLGLANLILLPLAGRLRAVASEWVESQELLMDGVSSLIDLMNPTIIESKLSPYLDEERDEPTMPKRAPLTMVKGAGA